MVVVLDFETFGPPFVAREDVHFLKAAVGMLGG